MLISPAMGFEAVRLLLTAGINHPRVVPLWGRARLVSFAVAARQEGFPGWGRICFTFILCFWRLLLNQSPLDVVISERFRAAVCRAGGEGKGSRDIRSGNVSQWSKDPCGVLRDAGAGCQATVGGHRTSQCRVHAALPWTKALCLQCAGVGITQGDGPAGGSVSLHCLSGSLNPCPMSALAVASLLQRAGFEPKHPGVIPLFLLYFSLRSFWVLFTKLTLTRSTSLLSLWHRPHLLLSLPAGGWRC